MKTLHHQFMIQCELNNYRIIIQPSVKFIKKTSKFNEINVSIPHDIVLGLVLHSLFMAFLQAAHGITTINFADNTYTT